LKWLPLHVNVDGVYFEHSSYYHRFTTDFYTHFLILSQVNGEVLPAAVQTNLQALLDHLMYITRPDGTSPLIGDDDGGRLVTLERNAAANDFRASLSTGAALFDRKDYRFVAGEGAEETLWLLGPAGLRIFDSIESREPEAKSIAFSSSGYYVMRDSWTREANYLLFDCGPHGVANCGHAHSDALSFELAAKGRTLLVDPGTYTYTGSKELRDWFRGSTGHNTLNIDGQSTSAPKGPFSWKTIANGVCLRWLSRNRFDFVEGKHDGYGRLPQPVSNKRSILFLKKDYWIMRDKVESSGEHRADLWFHFDSGTHSTLEVVDDEMTIVNERDSAGGFNICAFLPGGAWMAENGWVSHCYGERDPAPLYAFSTPVEGNVEIVTFLLPQAGVKKTKSRVREVEAIGGKAFKVTHDKDVDIVMIRSGESGRVEMEQLASDFAWTWARFSDKEITPSELVLIDGQKLELQGREILKSTTSIKFLVTSRIGEQFCLETDEGTLDLSLAKPDLESLFADLNRQSEV